MAGGEGTRLRPLTSNQPKPMVPIFNKPIMEYIINLLKDHGITDIVVTLQFLPQMIKNYFGDGSDLGVNLSYAIEQSPLGTAGSVKNAEAYLDETFVVISGDALTDFDLNAIIDFHKQKKSLTTIALKRVENPLEFGVVITDESGAIERFLEKPSWGEVFSDPVLATAILDRLLHYSTTLNIKGESYRLKEKRRAGLLGQTPQPQPEEVTTVN